MKKILNLVLVILLSGSFCYAATTTSSNEPVKLIGVTSRTEHHGFANCKLHQYETITTTKYYNDDSKRESTEFNLLNPNGTIALYNCGLIEHHICDDIHYLIVGRNRLLFGTETGYLSSKYSYTYLKAVYNETRMIAKKGVKYGLIDVKENTIIPFQFDMIADYYDGSVKAELNKKFGILSITDGAVLLPVEYDELKYASTNILISKKNNLYGLVSHSGKIIVPTECNKIKSVKLFSPVYSLQKGELYGLADKYGRVLADIKYKKVKQKGDSLYVSLDGKNWELVDAEIIKY